MIDEDRDLLPFPEGGHSGNWWLVIWLVWAVLFLLAAVGLCEAAPAPFEARVPKRVQPLPRYPDCVWRGCRYELELSPSGEWSARSASTLWRGRWTFYPAVRLLEVEETTEAEPTRTYRYRIYLEPCLRKGKFDGEEHLDFFLEPRP